MSLHPRSAKHLLVAPICTLLLAAPQAMAANFSSLGDLAGGTFDSRVAAVSDDGSTIVGWSVNAAGTEAFRWTRRGGMQSLGVLADVPATNHNSIAGAVSADGSVIVGYGASATGTVAWRWTAATGMTSLGGLGGNDGFTRADAVSADGSTVVGYSSNSLHPNGTGYRWTQSTGMTDIGMLPGDVWSWARNINADGSTIIGQSNTFSGGQAYRWTAASGMTGLGKPNGATNSSAGDMSADGSIIAGGAVINGLSHAVIWSESGGWEDLGTLAGYQQASNGGISADGSLVFGQVFNYDQAKNTFTSEGTIWDRDHGMRSAEDWLSNIYGLDLTGWTINYVADISDDGKTLVGFGINPNGNTEAWVADLHVAAVPLPAGVWLMGSGLLAIGGLRRKRQGQPLAA
ncbi:VPLPA-CTERM sorting domain-containing protein [Methylomonas montana]|uniref:VPLPA-CTERM sorting domain-containing protein n=1 Tax=Methylomonas montana TaxID=3058963 RepID=UPI00265B0285|nr:VPLPA-CTERM sorting domain-containing protein [Methylomonas montana]WKJ90015.1 VPLPA-CTERM sorting domain-containing protein [Methylomonas montana]